MFNRGDVISFTIDYIKYNFEPRDQVNSLHWKGEVINVTDWGYEVKEINSDDVVEIYFSQSDNYELAE